MADALAKGKKPDAAPPPDAVGEDAFVRGTFQFWDWLQKNSRSVLVGTVGFALIVAGILYYVNFQASVQNQAAGDLAGLRLQQGTPSQLIPEYESYVGTYDGTTSADEARIVLARLYMDAGQPAEAIRVLGTVGEATNRPLGFAAASLLGNAQEASGDVEAAMGTWQSLANEARFAFQRRQAQASVARIHADAGRVAEAVTIYAALAEEAEADEDLVEAGVYKIRLGELRTSVEAAGS